MTLKMKVKSTLTNKTRTVFTAVLATALLAGTTAVALLQTDMHQTSLGDTAAQSGQYLEASIEQGQIQLACPPGIVDPGTETVEEDAQIWTTGSVRPTPLSGGGSGLTVAAQVFQQEPFFAGTFTAIPSGDLAGLLVQECVTPAAELVFAAGSTQVGHHTVLILSNPGAKPVNAEVEVFSAIGPVLEVPASLTVPAQSTVFALPGKWAPDEDRLGLKVTADGTGLAGWLQSSELEGEVPLGLSQLAGVAPSSQAVGFGLPAESATLRILNLGTQPDGIEASLLTSFGVEPLGGTDDVLIEARGVVDIDLSAIPADALGVEVTASQPIALSVRGQNTGEPFELDPQFTVSNQTLASATRPFTTAVLPPMEVLFAGLTDLGFGDFEAALTVANTTDFPATVTVNNEEITLKPGEATRLPVARTGESWLVTSDQPVVAALVVSATSEVGSMTSVMNVTEDSSASVQRKVQVLPRP